MEQALPFTPKSGQGGPWLFDFIGFSMEGIQYTSNIAKHVLHLIQDQESHRVQVQGIEAQ